MAARKKDEQINLLPQKGFQSSTSGRVLAWILTSFRIIVIVTEIIVMIAFLSRFWFDAQSTDLNEQIQQKQAVLTASKEFEIRFKDVQDRLKIFSEMTSSESELSLILSEITKTLPPDVTLTKFAVEEEKVKITAMTPSEKSIQQFIVNLSSNTKLKDVGLSELNTSPGNSSVLVFTLDGTMTKKSEEGG